MKSITINGSKRESVGKKATKALRNAEMVPCVLYGEKEPIHFAAKELDFSKLIYTPNAHTVVIKTEDGTFDAVLQDIQFHPVTEAVMHMDFLELVPGMKFKATVPVRLVGSSKGVKEGGKLLAKLRSVTITTTPEKAVDEVSADISAMELGSTIRVKDIIIPDGVVVDNTPAVPIASIEVPRALKAK